MSAHEQFADDLALYAVDALAGEDRAAMETHLAGCSACRLELEHLRGDGALFALSTLGPKPPQRARQRLLDAVAKEPRVPVKVAETGSRRSWWGALGWAATAVVIVLALKAQPQPQGKAFYLRSRGSLVFLATNMPPLPPNKAYELWLIPTQGAPMAAGMFKPDTHGRGTVINPPLPAGMEAKAFAITVENEAGASKPTMPLVMMGAGE